MWPLNLPWDLRAVPCQPRRLLAACSWLNQDLPSEGLCGQVPPQPLLLPLVSPLFLVQEVQTQLLVPVSKYYVTVLLQLGP